MGPKQMDEKAAARIAKSRGKSDGFARRADMAARNNNDNKKGEGSSDGASSRKDDSSQKKNDGGQDK